MTQETALSILKTGVNAFLTGEPGSGKTHTINRYIAYLREHGVEPAVTASTGIAATHIGGHTIHSWSGLGIRTEITPYELDALSLKEPLYRRVSKTSVLIIEEVSMLDARALESVDAIMQELRRDERPFGGMQVIFVGDFFQLPPVSKGEDAVFAFHADAWSSAKPVTCYLTEQYRQEDDAFLSLLTALRHQSISDEHTSNLQKRLIDEKEGEKLTATKLYSHNTDVDRINEEALRTLGGEPRVFTMESNGPKALVEQLKRGCLSPEVLTLKKGAVVMFTKNNFEAGFVNGTLGVIKRFNSTGFPVVETNAGATVEAEGMEWVIEEDGKVKARIIQLPLRLAWAITVHKSQGMSLDAALIDLSKAFEYGQGYVALSRVRTLGGLHLLGFNERALSVHPEVAARDAVFRRHSEAVETRFHRLTGEEKEMRQRTFIESVGGRWEPLSHTEQQEKRAPKKSTYTVTHELFKEGKRIAEIAEVRGITTGTVCSHLEKLQKEGKIAPDECMPLWEETGRDAGELENVCEQFKKKGIERLRPVYNYFNGAFTFEELRVARLLFTE